MSNQTSFLNCSPAYAGFGKKAEEYMVQRFPEMIESGRYNTIHIGRNRDGGVGDRGGYRVNGNHATMQSALYFETPEKQLPASVMPRGHDAAIPRIETRASDAVRKIAVERVKELVAAGTDKIEAEKRVADSIALFGYYDPKQGKYVRERVLNRVNDSVLSGMTTPYWDIAVIQKIFKQPFLRGYSDGMVSKIGIPNPWADLVQIFTETFEGMARVSNAAKTMGTFNNSISSFNKTGTMMSELINLVIDYESPAPNEQAIGGMPGNWLTNAVIGDRDAYANLMVDQLACLLWYFGHAESGFEGLQQIANRDGMVEQYDQAPADYLWAHDGAVTITDGQPVNTTVGADLLLKLAHFVADKMEELFFLPVTCKIRCSPILWKVLTFSQLSKVYNQANPLSIINNVFESQNKITATLASRSGMGLWNAIEIVPDPMLMPNTPFNTNPWDLMFMTFPTLQSEFDSGLSDLIMAPEPISNMILPSAPGYRDGVVRTSLKRIGSILAPVEKTVHIIEGIGTNNWYTP